MRRLFSLLLTIAVVFALCACGEKPNSNTTKHVDEISIEGVSFEPHSSSSYNMRVLARNNGFPQFEDRNIINVVVYFRLVDASGNALPANISFIESWSEFPNLPDGQDCWTTALHTIDKKAVDSAAYIEFNSYELRYSQNAQGEWLHLRGHLSEPVSFEISDVL